jgi:hypothetical protein
MNQRVFALRFGIVPFPSRATFPFQEIESL